jgi:hypothetical protein
VGDSEHSVAGELELGVPLAVPLEGSAVAVEGVSVELDDQSLRGPHGVHFHARHDHVEAGQGEVGPSTELQEPAFELGAGDRRRVEAFGDHGTQSAHATTTAIVIAGSGDGPGVEKLKALGLLQCRAELGRAQKGSQV